MDDQSTVFIPRQFTLDEWNEREYELAEKTEELESQKEELDAAIEEIMSKNEYLTKTLEELSQRKEELDQLIYRMSHDLRTPVTSILGVCHVMRMEGLPTSFFYHLDHIQKKGLELDTILKSLTAFSQAAFMDVNHQPVNLSNLLPDVLDSLHQEAGFSDAHFSLACNVTEHVQADRTKLFTLIRNIVKNALDFRSEKRQLKIEIEISLENQSIIFKCKDNGVGIEDAIKPHIFRMFYRGSEKSIGSGLGLYVVKEIVSKLKGGIEVINKSHETSFVVTIPIS
jgi:signal transduction histidine kinase